MCAYNPQPSPTGPLPCDTIPFDADATVDMTRAPVFTFVDAAGDKSYLTRLSDVSTALDGFVARHSELSVYAIGLGGAVKFEDGYRVVVTDGARPTPDAKASVWYLRPDGRIVSVIDEHGGLGAAALASSTGTLASPLLEPEH